MVTLAGCSSGPPASVRDGYYYAKAYGFPSGLTPLGNSAVKQCKHWATTHTPKSDQPEQWEQGCEERIDGQPLSG